MIDLITNNQKNAIKHIISTPVFFSACRNTPAPYTKQYKKNQIIVLDDYD